MGEAIGAILANAVGVAISPVPIIAVILMLFSARATANSVSLLAGWIIGLSLAGGVVLALGLEGSDGEESTSAGWIKLGIGLLFVLLAGKQWTSRPRGDDEPEMPAWMATIDDFTAPKSFAIGFVLAAVNPKNLGLTIAAVVKITGSGLTTGEEIAVLAVFVVVASVSIAAPVVFNLVAGDRAAEALDSMKTWLIANNNTVMAVLLLVLGAKLIGDGITVVAA